MGKSVTLLYEQNFKRAKLGKSALLASIRLERVLHDVGKRASLLVKSVIVDADVRRVN